MAKPGTNATRLLDQRHIPYDLFTYSDALRSAEEVAEALGLPADEVYKTLVLQNDAGRPFLVMVPGGNEVEPKVLARAIGEKAVRMAPKREAEQITGLQTGGIGALALLHKRLPVYIDRRALRQERIAVNAGKRGMNVRLAVHDLVQLTGAEPVQTSEAG